MMKSFVIVLILFSLMVTSALAQQGGRPSGFGNVVVPDIHQVHLEDSDSTTCEAALFPDPDFPETFGFCPNDSRIVFIIHDPVITPDSVVMGHLGDVPRPRPLASCKVRFINPVIQSFNFYCDGPVPDGLVMNYVVINP